MGYLWLGKYLTQKVISSGPFGQQFNTSLQKRLGALKRPVIHGYPRTLTMLWLLSQCGISLDDAKCVELGTGWDLSSAMTLARLGISEINTYDHIRHLVPELRETAREMLETGVVPTDEDLPFEPPFADLVKLMSEPKGTLRYVAPFDARRVDLNDETMDFYYSLATLEHIPFDILRDLLKESFRVLKRGAFCYHYIQPSMHSWRGKESSIDYLIFSSQTWERWIANPISYENRLRAVEHLELLKSVGFELVRTWFHLDPAALAKLKRARVAAEFQHFTHEQLAQDYVWVIARKP